MKLNKYLSVEYRQVSDTTVNNHLNTLINSYTIVHANYADFDTIRVCLKRSYVGNS